MKISALVTVQLCALFMCHTTAETGSRPKRTLKFFENLMNSMREAFAEPPDLPPPEVIAKVASLPYSNPYTYFPTVRMHIRPVKPVEKHVVYVKTLPPPGPAPLIMKPNLNDVEIIRLIQPLVRRPKSNSATIHYEIIPITIPIQEIPVHGTSINHGPLSGDSEFENEDTAFSNVPWSLDALPPPVPTSKPFDSNEEHQVPWQLQALPPPLATKRPSWEPVFKSGTSNNDDMFFPLKKKIMIPAMGQQQPRSNSYDDKFVPSSLQSEISVQPSMELTAFSETDSMTVPPISNFRGRRIFEKKDARKSYSRPKRDTWANFPVYAELPWIKFKNGSTSRPASGNQSVPLVSSVSLLPPLTFSAKNISKVLPPLEESIIVVEDPMKYKNDVGLKSEASRVSTTKTTSKNDGLMVPLDFGEYSDNEDADKEDSASAYSEKREKRVNFTDDAVSIVKSHDILSDHPIHHEYIPTKRRPDSSRESLGPHKNNKHASRRLTSGFSSLTEHARKPFNSESRRPLFKSGMSERHRPSAHFESSSFTSFPEEGQNVQRSKGYFSKSSQNDDAYDDLFGRRHHQKNSGGRYFDESPKSHFDKSPKSHFDESPKSHFDDSFTYKYDFDASTESNFDHSSKYDFDKPATSQFDEPSRSDSDKAAIPKKYFGKSAVKYDFDKPPPRYEPENPSEYDSEKPSGYDFSRPINSDYYKDDKENLKRPHSDYENIEYFEPVIIDIDSAEKSFGNFVSKFRPKSKPKNTPVTTENHHSNEPLKLPDSLHETVDVIKMKSAHPPTFDLMGEADDEHTVVAMIEENQIS